MKCESLPVYSQMSSGSRVIKTLKRGDKVTVEFDVSTGPEEWCSIIEEGQAEHLGFVKCKELDRPPTHRWQSRRVGPVQQVPTDARSSEASQDAAAGLLRLQLQLRQAQEALAEATKEVEDSRAEQNHSRQIRALLDKVEAAARVSSLEGALKFRMDQEAWKARAAPQPSRAARPAPQRSVADQDAAAAELQRLESELQDASESVVAATKKVHEAEAELDRITARPSRADATRKVEDSKAPGAEVDRIMAQFRANMPNTDAQRAQLQLEMARGKLGTAKERLGKAEIEIEIWRASHASSDGTGKGVGLKTLVSKTAAPQGIEEQTKARPSAQLQPELAREKLGAAKERLGKAQIEIEIWRASDASSHGMGKGAGLNTLVSKTADPQGTEEQTKARPKTLLPPFKEELQGVNPVRVRNPNDFAVTAGLRAGEKGRDFEVRAHGVNTVYTSNGRYDIYFVYSDKPNALFQGDSFTLNNNGVEIQIVKVVDGNYGIRQVK